MCYVSSAIIGVRIPKELKDKVNRYGVKIGEVVRKVLEDEVRRRTLKG